MLKIQDLVLGGQRIISNSAQCKRSFSQFPGQGRGRILKEFWQGRRIKSIGPMPPVALRIPPVFHEISDTSVENMSSLILGAAALLLRKRDPGWSWQHWKPSGVNSEIVANRNIFDLGFFFFLKKKKANLNLIF